DSLAISTPLDNSLLPCRSKMSYGASRPTWISDLCSGTRSIPLPTTGTASHPYRALTGELEPPRAAAASSAGAPRLRQNSLFPLRSRSMQFPEKIWHNGTIKPWAEATTHVMAHAIHYGSSVFEGIRAYDTPKGTAIFRLRDHTRRLFGSAKIYDIAIPYTPDEIDQACRDIVRANGLRSAYLRPVAFRGVGSVGIAAETPIDVAIAALDFGRYLGAEALEQGI